MREKDGRWRDKWLMDSLVAVPTFCNIWYRHPPLTSIPWPQLHVPCCLVSWEVLPDILRPASYVNISALDKVLSAFHQPSSTSILTIDPRRDHVKTV
jgi:hypothetical protein